jgi:hypothetical protein
MKRGPKVGDHLYMQHKTQMEKQERMKKEELMR